MFSGCPFSGSCNRTQVVSPPQSALDVSGLNYKAAKKLDQ